MRHRTPSQIEGVAEWDLCPPASYSLESLGTIAYSQRLGYYGYTLVFYFMFFDELPPKLETA